jgi:hypothetical protein
MVSCLVTTAGGVEEDLMKCLAPHYIGSTAKVEGFNLKGIELRKKGINRIGNLLVRKWEEAAGGGGEVTGGGGGREVGAAGEATHVCRAH